MGITRTVIKWAALGIEILGASVIVAGVLRVAITCGTVRYLFQLDKPGAPAGQPTPPTFIAGWRWIS